MLDQGRMTRAWIAALLGLTTLAMAGCPTAENSPAPEPLQQSRSAVPSSNQSPRPPIYDEQLAGAPAIAAALTRARAGGKHVLIEWGGNWCSWCYKLHDVFHNDPIVQPLVTEHYELLLLDEKLNRQLMEEYGGKETQFGFPHLTVLDAQGKVLTNQETGSLETGDHHDPEKVAAFLKQWRAGAVAP